MTKLKPQTVLTRKQEWLLISELAKRTTYKRGYLSLMARQGKLKARKHEKNWYSTVENLKLFEEEKKKIKSQRNDHLRRLYREKSAVVTKVSVPKNDNLRLKNKEEKAPVKKISVTKDNIFDEVQKELEEVLREIREKQRRLKKGFPAYKKGKKAMPEETVEKERKETEDISEKLIMDLGKLINTANEVQEGKKIKKADQMENIGPDDLYAIPVKRVEKIEEGRLVGRSIDLERRNLVSRVNDEGINKAKIAPIEKENFLNESYNYFPFEREERFDEGVDATSKILVVVIVLLLLIAVGLIFLIFAL